MGVTEDELTFVADQISWRIGYQEAIVDGLGSSLPYSCEEILTAQEAGEDPTAWWREGVRQRQSAAYHSPAPAHVGAAFVMQWYLGVVATPAAFASVFGAWVLDTAPESLRFDLLDPELYPCTVSLRPENVEIVVDETDRLALAQERYMAHAMRFADSYRPGVKMGSRQRYGMVRDCWRMAVDAAMQAIRSEPGSGRLRESCCFIYALPGARACAACPRNAARVG